jgi:hypothetical protein
MAFDYQSLKKLTSDSLVDGTVATSDIANSAVTTAKIANSAIGSSELASGAVNVTSSTVTGTLPISKGGTGLTGVGSAYQALVANGSNNGFTFANTGIRSMSVFTGNGTWNKPSGVRFIKVQIQAGGGGASGHGESGAAGGYAEEVIDVTGINSVSVSIGGGGSGTYYSGAAGNGGGSSFGPYVSAGGGHGANRHNQHNGGLSGVGSGGNFNSYCGCGGGHEQRSSGMGGSSHFGGAAPAGHPQGGHFAHNHQGHSAPGTGGTSGYFSGHRGSDGRPGICVITEYY